MKIRNGFVSNSSSSSFIVGCDKVPESVKEMKDLIGEVPGLKYHTKYDYTNPKNTEYETITEDKLAKQVFKDMTKISIDAAVYEDDEYEYDNSTYKDTVIEDSFVSIEEYNNEIRKEILDYFSIYFSTDREIINNYLEHENIEYGYITPLVYFFKEVVRPEINKSMDRFIKRREVDESIKRVSWLTYDKELVTEFKEAETHINMKVNEIGRRYQDLAKEELLKSKEFFTVTYADDEGAYFSALEHGNIFRNTKVAICSMH